MQFRTTNLSRSLALIRQTKTDISSVKQEISVQRELILNQFKSFRDALKIRLTEVEEGQRQNGKLQDASETLTTLQQEITEKDEQLSNKHAVINLLRTYIEENKAGSRVFGTRSKIAGFMRKTLSLDKQLTSK